MVPTVVIRFGDAGTDRFTPPEVGLLGRCSGCGVLPQYRDHFQQHPFPRFTDLGEKAPHIEDVEDDAPAPA